MTKLLDADKLLEHLYILDGIWSDDDNVPFVLGSVMSSIKSGAFNAAGELQPEEPRQTLVEALKDAPVGTRYRHRNSSSTEWIFVISPGKSYSNSIYNRDFYADGPKPPHNVYEYNGLVRYADEFIIEYPTY